MILTSEIAIAKMVDRILESKSVRETLDPEVAKISIGMQAAMMVGIYEPGVLNIFGTDNFNDGSVVVEYGPLTKMVCWAGLGLADLPQPRNRNEVGGFIEARNGVCRKIGEVLVNSGLRN